MKGRKAPGWDQRAAETGSGPFERDESSAVYSVHRFEAFLIPIPLDAPDLAEMRIQVCFSWFFTAGNGH